MTSASVPENAIFLQPLEDAESMPLRRWLGREGWRGNPVISMYYEPDGDRILFRVIDTPSTASGVVGAADPASSDGELFIGFDGTDACAWPTTVALLGFLRHHDQDTSQARIARQLIGEPVWAAALSLRAMAGSEREIRLSLDEAARLIRGWAELVAGPISEAADLVVARWSAETTERPQDELAAGHQAPGSVAARSLSAVTSPHFAALAGAVGSMSRSLDFGRNSIDSGQAGRPFEEPEATGAGAAMARRSPMASRSPTIPYDPPGPLRYGLLARMADIWAARRDGRANVPPLPRAAATPGAADTRHGITPYMEVRNRHFLDSAEREHRRMVTDLAETGRLLAEVRQQIAGADIKAVTVREAVASMASSPSDPVRRNLLEQHTPEVLVRARRQREFDARRSSMAALGEQAADAAVQLRAQEARLTETIVARKQILDSHVRQLLQHSLRRCGTYMRHIVHHHPRGSAVIPYLKLALPTLPDWVESTAPIGPQAGGQAGASANGHAGGPGGGPTAGNGTHEQAGP